MANQTQTHNYKPDDIVKVFEDPITKQKLEGTARILKCCETAHYYQVEFQDEQGRKYYRFIY